MEQNKKTEEPKSAVKAAAPVEEAKPKSVLELLEEDDEFEEFEGGSWETAAAQAIDDTQLWKDDWEDDDMNDDFSQQLRAQIEARSNTGN